MTVLQLVKDAQELLKQAPSLGQLPVLGFFDYLDQYKHIALRLPRRSGKSWAAAMLHQARSSLLFSNYIGNRFNYENESDKLRGKKFNGLKYDFIIFDEYPELPRGTEVFVKELAIASLISENFHLIRLHT